MPKTPRPPRRERIGTPPVLPLSETPNESSDASAVDGSVFKLPEGVAIDGLFGYYEGLKRFGNDSIQASALLGTSSEIGFADGFRAKLGAWGGYFRNTLSDPDPHAGGEVREASLAYGKRGIDVEVGQLYLPWGKTDGINPTDYLTAKDVRFISSDDRYKRRGAPGVSLAYTPKEGTSPLRLELVALGRYAQTSLYIPPAAVPAGIALDQNAPSNDAREFAARATVTGEGWDASVSGFTGKNHLPQFVADGFTIRERYLDRQAIGADFSRSFSQYVLRFEGAYSMQEKVGQMRSEPDHLDLVAGLERGFGDRSRVILQFLYKYNADWSDPDTAYDGVNPIDTRLGRGIAAGNALLLNYQNESNPGVTLAYAYTGEDDVWKFDLSGVAYFVSQDFLVRPTMGYKFAEHFRANVGAEIYGGPERSPLGSLRDNRNAFLEVRTFF